MKPMNDKCFLDTNIIVYAHTNINREKQKTSQNIIAEKDTVISTQVLQETANTLVKKFRQSWQDVMKVLDEASSNNELHLNRKHTLKTACQIAEKYQFSFYDSLIIASALECGCYTLYSEDLQHGQIIEDKLKIINPFF